MMRGFAVWAGLVLMGKSIVAMGSVIFFLER